MADISVRPATADDAEALVRLRPANARAVRFYERQGFTGNGISLKLTF